MRRRNVFLCPRASCDGEPVSRVFAESANVREGKRGDIAGKGYGVDELSTP
jgi:hypothetical protein